MTVTPRSSPSSHGALRHSYFVNAPPVTTKISPATYRLSRPQCAPPSLPRFPWQQTALPIPRCLMFGFMAVYLVTKITHAAFRLCPHLPRRCLPTTPPTRFLPDIPWPSLPGQFSSRHPFLARRALLLTIEPVLDQLLLNSSLSILITTTARPVLSVLPAVPRCRKSKKNKKKIKAILHVSHPAPRSPAQDEKSEKTNSPPH